MAEFKPKADRSFPCPQVPHLFRSFISLFLKIRRVTRDK
jgi:hypothetical protein